MENLKKSFMAHQIKFLARHSKSALLLMVNFQQLTPNTLPKLQYPLIWIYLFSGSPALAHVIPFAWNAIFYPFYSRKLLFIFSQSAERCHLW
jgi:hypothetical protein